MTIKPGELLTYTGPGHTLWADFEGRMGTGQLSPLDRGAVMLRLVGEDAAGTGELDRYIRVLTTCGVGWVRREFVIRANSSGVR